MSGLGCVRFFVVVQLVVVHLEEEVDGRIVRVHLPQSVSQHQHRGCELLRVVRETF